VEITGGMSRRARKRRDLARAATKAEIKAEIASESETATEEAQTRTGLVIRAESAKGGGAGAGAGIDKGSHTARSHDDHYHVHPNLSLVATVTGGRADTKRTIGGGATRGTTEGGLGKISRGETVKRGTFRDQRMSGASWQKEHNNNLIH
jgi:hypothetical protein